MVTGWIDHDLDDLYAKYRSGENTVGDFLIDETTRRLVSRLKRAWSSKLPDWELKESCHDASIQMMQNSGRIPKFGQALKYARTVARFILLKRLRKKPRSPTRVVALPDGVEVQCPDSGNDSVMSLAIEFREGLTVFMKTLGCEERRIFRSLINGTPTIDGMAKDLGRSGSSVKRIRHDLRERFRAWIHGDRGGWGEKN